MMFSIRTSTISVHCLSWIVFLKCASALLQWIDLREWIERFDSRRGFFVIIIIQTATSFDRDRLVQSSRSSTLLHGRFCGKLDRFSRWKYRRSPTFGKVRCEGIFLLLVSVYYKTVLLLRSSFVRESSALPGINLRL